MPRLLISALVISVAITCTVAGVQAKSIKHDVPAATLAAFCAEHGVGSETNATLSFDNGTSLTGSIHCEAEDLVAGSDDNPATHDVGDDKGGRREAEAGDDHGGHANDHSGHGGGSDDNSGSDHSGGSDDHGGHGGHGGDD